MPGASASNQRTASACQSGAPWTGPARNTSGPSTATTFGGNSTAPTSRLRGFQKVNPPTRGKPTPRPNRPAYVVVGSRAGAGEAAGQRRRLGLKADLVPVSPGEAAA